MIQRTWRVRSYGRIVRCLVVAAVTVAVVSGCSASEPREPTDTPTVEEKTTEPDDKLADEPSDGAQVELVESAVTVTESADGDPMASYAVVVLNPSADMALYTGLDIQILDDDGEPVLDLDADRDVVHSAAYLIMPGQTQTVGSLTYIEREDVESLEVDIGDTKWTAAHDDRFMPLTADEVVPEPDGDGAVVTFEVDSPYDKELTAVDTYAIFRDSAGELLGASAPIDADPLAYVPGVNDGEIEVSTGVPPNWDPDSTAVYVDPFVD